MNCLFLCVAEHREGRNRQGVAEHAVSVRKGVVSVNLDHVVNIDFHSLHTHAQKKSQTLCEDLFVCFRRRESCHWIFLNVR